MKLYRAVSLMTVNKAVDSSGKRTFSGWATTPELDRHSDVVDPMGAKFTNPLALLHQHNSDAPIGTVTLKKATKKGIEFEAEIPNVEEPGLLKDRVDMAWGEIKHGLVRAVSIGFRALKYAWRDDGGIDFLEIEIYELSTVSVPAQAGALITQVKSFDQELRRAAGVAELPRPTNDSLPAASGKKAYTVVRLTPPASGKSAKPKTPEEGQNMKVSEKIRRFEEKRATNTARIIAIHEESEESLSEAQADEIKTLEAEVDTIDRDLVSLKRIEAAVVKTAKPATQRRVDGATVEAEYVGPIVSVKAAPKLLPGMEFIQLVKVKMASQLMGVPALVVARGMYGENSLAYGTVQKANEVAPGATVSGNWAADLVSTEGAAVAAFLEFLRPQTIVGKFGSDGIPALTRLDFYTPYVTQTGGGEAYWVGEGKPKPLTSFDFDRSTLTPLKIANICVLTEENIKFSTPNSDMIVRDQLSKAIIAGIDIAFVDPANAGSATVKPASITNGADAIAAEGTGDADDVRKDIKSLISKFAVAYNNTGNGVIIMSQTNAIGLAMLTNALGQQEFPGMTRNGGILFGYPVIVSQAIGSVVVMVDASQIFLGDDGGIDVAISREASLEMKSVPLQDGMAPGTGAALVSMFQSNMVAIRAERMINWKRARLTAVAYLTGAVWGGAVNT